MSAQVHSDRHPDHKRFEELEEEITRDYLDGLGCTRLAIKYKMKEEIIRYRLRLKGVLDASRRFSKVYTDQNEKLAIRTTKNFQPKVKRTRFEEEKGCCQWCHGFIGEAWQEATYHHWIPVADGGGRESWNCMVLHKGCHEDNFEDLHFGRKSHFMDGYLRCDTCMRRRIDVTLDTPTCKRCLKPRGQWLEHFDRLALDLHARGLSRIEISRELKIDASVVSKKLKALGVASDASNPVDKELLARMLLEGKTTKEIMQACACSDNSVFKVVKNLGLVREIQPWIWEEPWAKDIHELLLQGKSLQQALDILSLPISYSGARYHMKKLGLPVKAVKPI